ncbi:MAG: hypothetical protein ACTHU0_22255 [Kofleriaceae bacterium]
MRIPLSRVLVLVLALCGLASTALADDLSSVRYQRDGSSHFYLSTHGPVRAGDVEVSLSLYLMADRYVAIYKEERRLSASESEVLSTREIAGGVSGATLANLGTLKLTGGKKNGKPIVELVLGQDLGAAKRALSMQLAWTGGSFAPKSVTGR